MLYFEEKNVVIDTTSVLLDENNEEFVMVYFERCDDSTNQFNFASVLLPDNILLSQMGFEDLSESFFIKYTSEFSDELWKLAVDFEKYH